MSYFDLQANVWTAILLMLLVVKLWALVDAITRPAAAFPAADKLTKTAWIWITALAFVEQLVILGVVNILSLAGTVAAFVYILDVKPALASVTRRR